MTDDRRDNTPLASAATRVEQLVAANQASNDTMRKLVENVREDAYLREKKIDLLEQGLKQTHKVLLLCVVSVILMMIIGVINAANISSARHNAAVTAQTATDAARTYAILADCLNQAGACGRNNAKNTVRVLDEIKKYELTVIYCARTNPLAEDPEGGKFIACVKRLYPTGPELNGR